MRRNSRPISDDEQIGRYAYVLGNVPASVADRAYAAAFARLTAQQQRDLVDELRAQSPAEPPAEASGDHDHAPDPDAFARLMRDLYIRHAFVGARGASALAAQFVVSPPVVGYFTTGAGSVSIDQHPPWLQALAGHDTAPLDAGRMHHRKGVGDGEWFWTA